MASIGYRPRGSNGPLYNPERDYAYITPTLMRQAVENMESTETEAWRKAHDISEVEIVDIAVSLASAQHDFVNGADPVKTFEQALTRHGFYNFRLPVRQLLFASIGEIFCAAWFVAVREVSVVGEESPAQLDMARFAAQVCDFAARHGRPGYDPDHRAEALKSRNAVLQTRINMLGDKLAATEKELAACRAAAKQQAEEAAAQKSRRGWSLFKRS